MVFYRTYRPQTIGELDNSRLRERLHAVLLHKDVPHAFLFTGPKGLGKTSTARIVAKVLNCEHVQKGEPCNRCLQCVSITNGTNIDVLEIDGASNRGIDEIRDLRERVKLAPSAAKKKIYIIDEVHMLTTEAFNALLKTIEEPPSHVVFIFCTTEPQKVPATIASRCFHIIFTLATDDELVHSLERIATKEHIAVQKDALKTIAHLAEGGFRDAAKILEEMVTLSPDREITKAFVEEKYHIFGVEKNVKEFLSYVIHKKNKEALLLIGTIAESGTDMKFFTSQLLHLLHELLLQSAGIGEASEEISLQDVSYLLRLFLESYSQMKFATIMQLPLEMAVVTWAQSQAADQKEAIDASKPTMHTLIKKQQHLKVKNILYPQKEKKSIPGNITATQSDIVSRPTDEMIALMENIIHKVKLINASVAGVLRSCKVKRIEDGNIVFEAAYAFHKERLEDKKTCEIIEQVVKEITGKKLHLQAVLRGGDN